MPKEQQTFTKEFKLEAVRLVQNSGESITKACTGFRIADSKLHAEVGEQIFLGSGHQTAQEGELRRLKCEMEAMKQERDILKRVVHIYSRDVR